jgi:tetraacyldisaccharide 4'-kinase
VKSAPGFWAQNPPSALARLLQPLGAVAGALAVRRLGRHGTRAAVPVICVGNPVAGGAGKTPTALAIAALLQAQGESPAFLSRGYGGSLPGPVRVDPAQHRAGEVGDEPLLLAAHAPTIVARSRPAGARLAAGLGASVIVMDDGFQNPWLVKDLSFLVVDAGAGAGNGLCLPAGPLRAPLAAQFARAQALILIGEGAPGDAVAEEAICAGLPVHRARLVPDAAAVSALQGRRVLAFAGIGRPQKFADSLRDAGIPPVDLVEFPDHHPYTEQDAERLLTRADGEGLQLVTTEKDRARLAGTSGKACGELAARLLTLPVSLVFADAEAVAAQLAGACAPQR